MVINRPEPIDEGTHSRLGQTVHVHELAARANRVSVVVEAGLLSDARRSYVCRVDECHDTHHRQNVECIPNESAGYLSGNSFNPRSMDQDIDDLDLVLAVYLLLQQSAGPYDLSSFDLDKGLEITEHRARPGCKVLFDRSLDLVVVPGTAHELGHVGVAPHPGERLSVAVSQWA